MEKESFKMDCDFSFEKRSLILIDNLEKKYHNSPKSKISIVKLRKLAECLENYRPKSRIKEEKKMFINYLENLSKNDISNFSDRDLAILKSQYVLPIISNKLDEYGFRLRGTWFFGLIFIAILDCILIALGVAKFYFYIPFISVFFVVYQIKLENKAKKENKLW